MSFFGKIVYGLQVAAIGLVVVFVGLAILIACVTLMGNIMDNANKKKEDLSLVPEEERTQEESALFSYDYTYGNPNLYINIFLMPWIPEE